jgi:WD40 repeat protein/serine/threonine protein kinase/tetratricopeptide (TPR) repeat protein
MDHEENLEKVIFWAALERPAHERDAYVRAACRSNATLEKRVRDLLAASTQSEAGPVPPVPRARVPEPGTELIEGPGARIGYYRLLEKIGEGGMGVVYMAEQREPVIRKVALKIIKLGMDTRQVVARFEAERQALALMDHPNIAKVLDAGATKSGRPYFVMELVQGIPITRYCDEAHLDTQERLNLFTQVCSAIQHAHQKGIIHRDVKPSNVLVTLHGDQPVPKVIDFGIAKSTQQPLTDKTLFTQFQHFVGTPAYMSPEQASLSGLDIDTRSDIYALGVLLYELLTGKTPFDARVLLAAGYEEIRRIIREVDPPKPSTRLSTMQGQELAATAKLRGVDPKKLGLLIRGDLDRIVMKALAKDRARRYETANGLAADVKRFLRHEPVTAAAPSPGYRIRKFVERHRTPVLAGAAILILLITGIAATTWLALLATSARSRATAATALANQANQQLKQQVLETEHARQAESQERLRAENALQLMKVERVYELLKTHHAALGIAYLGRVLRSNPSNHFASTRLVSALLQRRFLAPLLDPLGPEGKVRLAEFSPDGQWVVTCSSDKTVQVWSSHTGQPKGPPLAHESQVLSAQFSPDGQRILTVAEDKTARIWDTRTGEQMTRPLRHDTPIRSAQFSPDGQRVVIASGELGKPGSARVCDVRTGEPVTEPLAHKLDVDWAQFSPDGRRVVTASTDHTAKVWKIERAGQPIVLEGHKREVWTAQFSPDGNLIVTGSEDGTARVWDASTGREVGQPFRHDEPVKSAQFSPDGQRVLTVSYDFTARIWDLRTGRSLAGPMRHARDVVTGQFSLDGQRVLTTDSGATVTLWDANTGLPLADPLRQNLFDPLRQEIGQGTARLSPDGLRILTVSPNGLARLWDARIGLNPGPALHHRYNVRGAQFSPDGLRLATGCEDGTARVWDVSSGRPLTPYLHHEGPVIGVQFSPDGQRLLTISFDATARLWDAHTGQSLGPPLRHQAIVRFAQFSPDGHRIVTGSFDHTAQVWDASTGQRVAGPFRHAAEVWQAQFSPDRNWVVTACADGTARVWDVRTGQPVGQALRHRKVVMSAQFSPDGQRVVTASADGTARVWNARTGDPLTEPLQHADQVRMAEFSPDGRLILTASEDYTARLWDAQTGESLIEPLRHEGFVVSASFSPDGRRVATASWDHTARVWDVSSGQPLTEPLRHEDLVYAAQFSPDNRRLVTISQDHTARLWDVPVVPIPVPAWFVEWAEALAGRRLNAQGTEIEVPTAERRRRRVEASARSGDDFFAQLAQWVQADPDTRTISLYSPIKAPDYVRDRLEEYTLASLEEAISISPTNGRAFARLARSIRNQDPAERPGHLEEAQFYAQYGLRLNATDDETWRILATIQLRRGYPAEALQSVDRSLGLEPRAGLSWLVKGVALEKTDRPQDALAAYTRAIEALPPATNGLSPERSLALGTRAGLLRNLNRFSEAVEDIRAAYAIPARPAEAGTNLVDLSACYNTGLRGNWFRAEPDEGLGELPTGVQNLAGTVFDLRGLVQLGQENYQPSQFPQQASLPVARKCRRLHFLHGVLYGSDQVGTVIARYVAHYADGGTQERPLVLGKDALDWLSDPPPSSAGGEPNLAWAGTNASSRELGKRIHLYTTVWENPRPETEIVSIDFVRAKQNSFPFLVAITLD